MTDGSFPNLLVTVVIMAMSSTVMTAFPSTTFWKRRHRASAAHCTIPAMPRLTLRSDPFSIPALSDSFLENDLVSVRVPRRLLASLSSSSAADGTTSTSSQESGLRFCVVRPDATIVPLCRHEDDVETDLFIDPRTMGDKFWQEEVTDELIDQTYGEGWYGQRPVPSLGGGPGYGAEADEIWSIDEPLLLQLEEDGVELPVLDVGIAHGEKARGGAY